MIRFHGNVNSIGFAAPSGHTLVIERG